MNKFVTIASFAFLGTIRMNMNNTAACVERFCIYYVLWMPLYQCLYSGVTTYCITGKPIPHPKLYPGYGLAYVNRSKTTLRVWFAT